MSFWDKVDMGGTDDCWPWMGRTDDRPNYMPYGLTTHEGKHWKAHRLAFYLHYGVLPDGTIVRHNCDNPRCCNPHHMVLGTTQDNVDDKMRRGRAGFNKKGDGVKLNLDIARIIRNKHAQGRSILGLSHEYEVSRTQIRRIIRGERWLDEASAV